MSKNLIEILFKQENPEVGADSAQRKRDSNLASREATEPDDKEGSPNLDRDAYEYFIKTFQNHGFDFYIEFADLKFDYKNDFVGGGGYGEVFRANWMGTPVAVKRFGRKCISKKYIVDFIKEIEIVNQLRDMNFHRIKGEGFMPIYTRTDFTDALHDISGFRTDYQIISDKEMKKIYKSTKK